MRTRIHDLALRRQMLVAKSSAQRKVAAQATAEIRRELASVERAVGVLRYLGRKPMVVVVAAVAMALLITKPRQTATWLGYAVTIYTMFRRARRLLFPQGTT